MKTISALATSFVAGAATVRVTPTVPALATVLLLTVLLIAGTGCFLRCYLGLSPADRADVRKLIRSLRER